MIGFSRKKIEPNLVRETVSESTSEFIRHALFMTVDDEEGTGKAGRVAGYKVGGKTGTAEKLPRSAHNYLVSFCGFAPADDPASLYVVIDTPNLPGKRAGAQYIRYRDFPEDHGGSASILKCIPRIRIPRRRTQVSRTRTRECKQQRGRTGAGTGETGRRLKRDGC